MKVFACFVVAVSVVAGCGAVERALPQEAQDTIQQARAVKQSGQEVLDTKREGDVFIAEIERTKASSPEARAFVVRTISDPNPAVQLIGLSVIRAGIRHDRSIAAWAGPEVQKHIDQLKAQGSQEVAVWTTLLREIMRSAPGTGSGKP